jgi:hypothetical protein
VPHVLAEIDSQLSESILASKDATVFATARGICACSDADEIARIADAESHTGRQCAAAVRNEPRPKRNRTLIS